MRVLLTAVSSLRSPFQVVWRPPGIRYADAAAEIEQFATGMADAGRVARLLRLQGHTGSGDVAHEQEQFESVASAFCRRIKGGYWSFRDLVSHPLLAALEMRLGVALCTNYGMYGAKSTGTMPALARNLREFPVHLESVGTSSPLVVSLNSWSGPAPMRLRLLRALLGMVIAGGGIGGDGRAVALWVATQGYMQLVEQR